MTADSQRNNVAIVGGGLAGLAAGCALSDVGYRVTLFERRPYVGGRASSYEHPGTGEVVDNCQHVLLGCCTNLIHFYEQLNAADKIQWFDDLTFIEPGGRASRIAPTFLPAPFHNLPSFFSASSLSLADKLAIGRALTAMMGKSNVTDDPQQSFLDWLQRHKQTPQAIERFWKVVLVSALNEDLDRISVRYATQVFRESFLKSAAAGRMGVPRVPLSDLYGIASDYIRQRGGEILLRCSANAISPLPNSVRINGSSGDREFDYAVLAVPFQGASALLPANSAQPLKQDLSRFEASPITGIHLWFDREITPLAHAVLLDRTIQWMFQKSKFHDREGSYIELVVSASRTLVEKSRQEILDLALMELAEFFPQVREAKVVKAAVIKEIYATYSVLPGLDRFRPQATTVWPRLFLAGDWTATGWPATMEGAVRSGYLAAEALTKATGKAQKFLEADLPAKGLMKLFG